MPDSATEFEKLKAQKDAILAKQAEARIRELEAERDAQDKYFPEAALRVVNAEERVRELEADRERLVTALRKIIAEVNHFSAGSQLLIRDCAESVLAEIEPDSSLRSKEQ